MRSGRPSYHVKARWISCIDPTTNDAELYKLDDKGNIIKTNGIIAPQRTISFKNGIDPPDPPDTRNEQIKSEAAVPTSVDQVEQPISEIPFTFDEVDDFSLMNYDVIDTNLVDF